MSISHALLQHIDTFGHRPPPPQNIVTDLNGMVYPAACYDGREGTTADPYHVFVLGDWYVFDILLMSHIADCNLLVSCVSFPHTQPSLQYMNKGEG